MVRTARRAWHSLNVHVQRSALSHDSNRNSLEHLMKFPTSTGNLYTYLILMRSTIGWFRMKHKLDCRLLQYCELESDECRTAKFERACWKLKLVRANTSKRGLFFNIAYYLSACYLGYSVYVQ